MGLGFLQSLLKIRSFQLFPLPLFAEGQRGTADLFHIHGHFPPDDSTLGKTYASSVPGISLPPFNLPGRMADGL
jgi:hypothetical protein